ncbi:MAG TPA: hypothetical protein VGL02_19440 [Streptomyces sp.]
MPALRLADEPVLALTVHPPWSHFLAAGIKKVENRTWEPPGGWRGRLVIHAGMALDRHGFWFGARLGYRVDEDEVARGEYLAVADLADVHRPGPDCVADCAGWGEAGCFHWVLSRTRRITSVEGRGRQKLFVPPPDVRELALAA